MDADKVNLAPHSKLNGIPRRYWPRLFAVRLQRAGRWWGIYIPNAIVKGMGWSKGQLIEIELVEGAVRIKAADKE